MMAQSGQPLEPRVMVGMYTSAAQLHLMAGKTDRAIERIDQALDLCRQHELGQSAEYTLMTAGNILGKLDEDAASAFLAAQFKAGGENRSFQTSALKIFGQQLIGSGKLVPAIRVQHDYVKLVQTDSPESIDEIEALLTYGQSCLAAKIFDLGTPALKRAKQLAEKLNQPELVARTSFQFGVGLIGAGEYKLARDILMGQAKQSLAVGEDLMLPSVLTSLARAQIRLEEFDEAKETIAILQTKFAGTISDGIAQGFLATIHLAETLKNPNLDATGKKAAILKLKQLQQAAIEKKQQAMKTNSTPEMTSLMTAPDQMALAASCLLDGDGAAAEANLKLVEKSIDVYERSFQTAVNAGAMNQDVAAVSIADQRASVAEFRQQILVKSKKFEDALLVAERSRGTTQADLMRNKLGVDAATEKADPITLDRLKAIASDQRTTFIVYSLVHAFSREVRFLFDENQPAANPKELYCWIVKPEGAVAFKSVPLRVPINTLINQARAEIQKQPAAEVADPDTSPEPAGDHAIESDDVDKNKPTTSAKTGEGAMRMLHQLLIESLADQLPDDPNFRLTFVPQGSLFLVPFAALPDADGLPLIQQHTISVSPSIEILDLAKKQHEASQRAGLKDILIVGNPTMPAYQSRPDRAPSPLNPLKGAEAEAKYLGERLNVTPLIGEAASESAVVKRMEQARFIHLATHGLLESENLFAQSYLSAIALGPDAGEDGFLTVRETMKLQLQAEMAVLSACDTGRGKISGDGVIGLSRGYISAGVPTIVVSLWPVSDAATMVLMSLYYEAMLTGADKAAALRTAMLQTRKQFPNAREWAPFTIYGYAR